MPAFQLPTAFYAFPSSPPSVAEIARVATEKINNSKTVYIRTWEENRIGGKAIIGEICAAIDASNILLADLTGLNPNVLFEVGFAIAKGKRIWPVLDPSLGANDFTELRTLSTLGCAFYSNSDDIARVYFKDRPHEDIHASVLASLILPSLAPGQAPTLLYLKSQYENEASVQITKRLDRVALIGRITDDPSESPYQTLTWYGQQVYTAESVVCHMTNPARQGTKIRNARYALVAGMAFGMGKNVLILSEGDYLAPLDYRDMLRQYQTAEAAMRHLEGWIGPREEAWRATAQTRAVHSTRVRLAIELKGLNLGEYIAENEGERLIDGYFVETTAYREAASGTHTIFVGRKGAGKSANFLQLSASLQADPRNVVAVIKPVAYELEGILRILRNLGERDEKVYLIEGLWRFLLYSEVASAIMRRLTGKVLAARSDAENAFVECFETHKAILQGDFSTRLERCIATIESEAALQGQRGTDEFRNAVARTLHSGILRSLHVHVLGALPRGGRIAAVVDNLDKAWDRQSDLPSLAEFLLGLLSAASKVRQELNKDRADVVLSLAVFLRTDIFEKVQEVAREPDKIRYTRLTWTDRELLYKLLEARFRAANSDDVPPEQLWGFFCPTVAGRPTKHFLADSVLPRPRDFLYLVNAAVSTAVNRGHTLVEEDDIVEACKAYSEFASGILSIEDNSGDAALERVVYEFAGAPSKLSFEEVKARIAMAGIAEANVDRVVAQLCALSFFGIEVHDGDFRFAENSAEMKKVAVLSRQLCEERQSGPVYLIHRAFRPFLEVRDRP